MVKLKSVSRVNREASTNGVWIDIADEELDVKGGRYKCRYIDFLSQATKAKLEEPKRKARLDKLNDIEQLVDTLMEFSVVDWDMVDEDDKPVKFDPDLCREFLLTDGHEWVVLSIWNKALDAANFKAVSIAAQTETIAKN
ncbi:hypothetical protein [Sphingobium yanoikuyae]|uniref:hypothetical protein n=1 Tax=Sphingobium yanoikuyae TaxID=13690 RepID=UPI0035C7D995